jgi:hypothetical protein
MTKVFLFFLALILSISGAYDAQAKTKDSVKEQAIQKQGLEKYTVVRSSDFFGPPVPKLGATPEAHAAPNQTAEQPAALAAPFKEEGVSFDAEGFGLFHSLADGGLGKNLWDDAKRSEIIPLLETMPVSARYTGVQHLLFGTLLTAADTSQIENDIPPEAGRDLLSLRLRKLIDAGAYQQAVELYSKVPDEATSESIVRSGIYAMLFTGEEYLACVELKTVIDRYASLDFFKTLNAYCDVTLSDMPDDRSWDILRSSPDQILVTLASDKKFTFNYDPEKFSEFTFLERAMIVAEARLRSGDERRTNFKNVPPAHIQLLMKATDLTQKDKFLLSLRATEWGLMKIDDLTEIYKTAIDPDIRRDPALSVPASAEDWQRLPYLLQLAKNKQTDAEKWDFIRQSFPIGRKYGLTALTPFADILAGITPVNPTLEELQTVLAVLVRSEVTIPQQIIDLIKQFKFLPEQKSVENSLLSVALVAQTTGSAEAALRDRILAGLSKGDDLSTLFLRNIIENIDKHGAPDHNAVKIYDKQKNLTLSTDYVMPSEDVMNRLIEASRKGKPGETVLLSATVLNENSLDRLHPAAFQDVLQSLKFVGLTDISRNVAMEAVLGSIQY